MLKTKCISSLVLFHMCVCLLHWGFSEALCYKALDYFPKAIETDQVQTAKCIPWQDSPASISREVCHLPVYKEILDLPIKEAKGF